MEALAVNAIPITVESGGGGAAAVTATSKKSSAGGAGEAAVTSATLPLAAGTLPLRMLGPLGTEALAALLRLKGVTMGTHVTGLPSHVCAKDLLDVPDPISTRAGIRHRTHLSRTPAGPGQLSSWETARAALGSVTIRSE